MRVHFHATLKVAVTAFVFVISSSSINKLKAQCNQKAIFPRVTLWTDLDPQETEVTEFVIPKSLNSFILNCTFQQPIDWKFEGVKVRLKLRTCSTAIIFHKKFETFSFNYSEGKYPGESGKRSSI